jgi:hypothetical protein
MNRHQTQLRRTALRRTVRAAGAALMVGAVAIATSVPAFATSLGPSNAYRVATAKNSARGLLTIAPLPPGTKRISTWIAADGKELSSPMSSPADIDQVDLARFYLAPHASESLTWLFKEKIDGHARTGLGTSSGPGTGDESTLSFSFPSTSLLAERTLEYSLLPVAHGELEIRVDALVTYAARKSPYSIIASGAVKVVIVVNRGSDAKHDRVSTYVTTNTKTISELRTKVNDLPPARTGVSFCPADFGASLTLRFYRAGATTPYAVVVADPGGCGSVSIRDYDAMDALMSSTYVSGGATLGAFVAKKFDIKTLEVI